MDPCEYQMTNTGNLA